MKKSVVFFEVEGGNDKGPDGHRKDTMPMVEEFGALLERIPQQYTNDDGSDKYVLGEINCSCVGFTSHLDSGIQETVANEIIRVTSTAAE